MSYADKYDLDGINGDAFIDCFIKYKKVVINNCKTLIDIL